MIGRRIGNYEIVKRLGRGGVGDVYVGVDRLLNRPVAIKSLRPEFRQDPVVVTRFRGEAESLARLNHPNIATIYALQPDGDEFFMVMELVHGMPLDDIIGARGRFDERTSVAAMAQAVDGLASAHQAGVIHRDIKPSNLMITPEGVLKVMDFGIARVRGSSRLTRQGHIVGTIAYMAPEQILGREADERSDVYSLAIVLYEMLSGRTPFETDSEYKLLKAQVEQPPPRLLQRLPGVSSALDAAVQQALSKKPEKRFQTVQAFGDSLGINAVRAQSRDLLRTRASGLSDVAPMPALLWEPTASVSGARPSTPFPATRLQPSERISAPDPVGLVAGGGNRVSNLESSPKDERGVGWRPVAVLVGVAAIILAGLAYMILEPAIGVDVPTASVPVDTPSASAPVDTPTVPDSSTAAPDPEERLSKEDAMATKSEPAREDNGSQPDPSSPPQRVVAPAPAFIVQPPRIVSPPLRLPPPPVVRETPRRSTVTPAPRAKTSTSRQSSPPKNSGTSGWKIIRK